jgi:hypothetical protein
VARQLVRLLPQIGRPVKKLSGTTARAEAAERLREEARQKLAEHQATTGHR